MKLIRLCVLALALIAFGLNSCKKSGTTPKTSNSVSMKFNGTAYSTTTMISATYSKGAFQIVGTFNSTTNIYLAIPSGIKMASFDMSTGAGDGTFTMGSAGYFADTGSITINSFTATTVSGTFEFSGTDLLSGNTGTVTDGNFQANYTTQ